MTSRLKIMPVFGTRPEAIKLAPVIKAADRSGEFDVVTCVTSQHREMLQQALGIFGIKPDFDLNIMQPDQTLSQITSRVMAGFDEVLTEAEPDIVVVQGDTSTTFAAALAAFHRQIPIAYVESGLRSGNLAQPFPEEANRLMTTRIADIHFCPTERNKKALLDEGISEERIHVTGNTVIDAVLDIRTRVAQPGAERLREILGEFAEPVERGEKRLILVTGHRRENFGDGLTSICAALEEIARDNEDCLVLYAAHLNPRVKGPVTEILGATPNARICEPLSYLEFVYFMDLAYLIITDSGGVQEEAPSFGKPVLVTREVTERTEGVEAGVSILVGTDSRKIVAEATRLLGNKTAYDEIARIENPFGDGAAAERIIDVLKSCLRR